MNAAVAPSLEGTRQAWSAVCERRGIRQPEATKLQAFLRGLEADALSALRRAIRQCMSGGESPDEMSTVFWAGACTRPDFLQKASVVCPACTSAALFAAGLILIPQGWDMHARIHNLETSPEDMAKLSEVLDTLVVAGTTDEGHPAPVAGIEADALKRDSSAAGAASASAFDLFELDGKANPAPYRTSVDDEQMSDHRHDPQEGLETDPEGSSDPRSPPQASGRPKVRLFGKDAAHSVEITNHRRAGDFMNVSVVTVDSARAIAGNGYDWRNKLVIQLTPEEMPAAIAVLMGLTTSCKFENHGSDRSKFVEMRNQDGGMMLVTGNRTISFAVPVKTPSIYYLLDLFCRAMVAGTPNRSGNDVITLVRSIYS
jgi:hypothetical protein